MTKRLELLHLIMPCVFFKDVRFLFNPICRMIRWDAIRSFVCRKRRMLHMPTQHWTFAKTARTNHIAAKQVQPDTKRRIFVR